MPYLLFNYDLDDALQVGQTGKPTARQKGTRYETAWRTFYTETTRGGVLLHPNHHWFVSASHTQADLDRTLAVCADAFDAVRRAI